VSAPSRAHPEGSRQAGSAQSPITHLEKRQLGDTFAELCRIESPSGHERACAEYVRAALEVLGVHVEEDQTSTLTGSDCGNLFARIPSSAPASAPPAGPASRMSDTDTGPRAGAPAVLLCAHLDTVPLHAPVEPVLIDGAWENANDGVLGADNKAAVAVMLALARHVCHAGAPVDVELLFTVGEELALAGARAFDATRLRSEFGYVFDHATPIGGVVMASPSHFRIEATFHGTAAHAGLGPQDGRSAILAAARAICSMRLGRVDEETTANVGTIAGGSAVNVVPERCAVLAEVRAIREEQAEALCSEMIERLHQAANAPECECDVDVTVQRTFAGYRTAPATPALRAAEAALRDCGHEPMRISSDAGSDANALRARGVKVVNLANGTEHNHEPGERVSERALEDMLEVALALLEQSAAVMSEDGS
jgi:tripeptide aminopeptidase